jgi:hypothetical protein
LVLRCRTTGLQIGVEKDALIVPTEVVQHDQNGLYVFIVDDITARRCVGQRSRIGLEGRTTAW